MNLQLQVREASLGGKKNIYNYPEVANFSNWNDKSYHEQWAFDAVKANDWLIKKNLYTSRCEK